MASLIGTQKKPSWITPGIAELMRDQVLMALAEAGYPDAKAHEYPQQSPNWYFTGAPHEAIRKAGELVARSWRVDERGGD